MPKFPHLADVVVNSLTKYANWEGDVMMGSLVFPRDSAQRQKIDGTYPEGYATQLLSTEISNRLAEQIPYYESFIEQTNASTLQVAQLPRESPEGKNGPLGIPGKKCAHRIMKK